MTAWALALVLSAGARIQAQGPSAETAPSTEPGSAGTAHGTIVLVRTRDDEHVTLRLRAELSASGFRVVEVGPDPALERASLAGLADTYEARAALRAHESAGKLELWVSGSPGAAETLTVPGPRPDETVLALRTAEALRARGLAINRSSGELGAAPARAPAASATVMPAPLTAAKPASEAAAVTAVEAPVVLKPEPAALPPPPKPAARVAEARDEAEPEAEDEAEEDEDDDDRVPTVPWTPGAYDRGLWLELAPALAYSPGGLPLQVSGSLALRLQPAPLWSLALFGFLPFTRAELSADEGSTRVAWITLGAGAAFHFRVQRFEFDAGAGVIGSHFALTGLLGAEAGLTRADVSVNSAGPFASVALHFNVGGGVRLGASALLGALLGRMVVRFADHEVARYGRPWFAATLGIELPLLALGG